MKIIRCACIVVIACVALIFVLGTFDWLTKYILYLQHREALYAAIQAGQDYETLKKTTSYLQGSATRTLNNLKRTCLYLTPLLIAAFYIYKKGN